MQFRCAIMFLSYPCKTMTIRSLRVTNNIGLMRALLSWRRRFSTCCINYKSSRAKTARGAAITIAIIQQEQQTLTKERFHRQNANTIATAAAEIFVDWSTYILDREL